MFLILLFLLAFIHPAWALDEALPTTNFDLRSLVSSGNTTILEEWDYELPAGNQVAAGGKLPIEIVLPEKDRGTKFEVVLGAGEIIPIQKVSGNRLVAEIRIPEKLPPQTYQAKIRSKDASGKTRVVMFDYIISGRIKKIIFKGLYHAQESTLRALLLTQEGDFPNSIKIDADRDRLVNQGMFEDVQIKLITLSRDFYNLEIKVAENPVLDEIEFVGLSIFHPSDLLAKMKTKTGQIFTRANFRDDLEMIRSLYSEKNYFLFKITDFKLPSANAKPAKLIFYVEEGRLGKVFISGNDKTKEFVLTREMTLQPGDVLSADAVKEDLRKIYNLNYFESVEPNLVPSLTDPGVTDLEIHVKEKKTSTATFGIGTSQITGTYGSVDLFLDNLWGEAKSLLFKTQFGSQYTTYQVRYHDPWALGYRTSFTGSLWSTQQVNYITTDREQRNGYSLAVGKPIAKNWRGTVSWLSEDVSILGTGSRVNAGGALVSNNTQGYNRRVIGLDVNYDTRDYIANPHTGEFYDFAVEKAVMFLGGTVDYWTFSAQGNWFYPVMDKHTVATRVWSNFATGQLQEADEYFVGSDRTVRGYNRPFSQGRERYLANVEYRIDINDVFQGVFFIDMGAAFNSISPVPYSSTGFRIGKGAGVRINTPLGPIRLDLGWGDGYDLNYGPVLHFSIGHAF